MTQPGGPLPPGVPPLAVQPVEPPPAEPSRLTGGRLLVTVLVSIAACGIPILGVLAALVIYGVRKYLTDGGP